MPKGTKLTCPTCGRTQTQIKDETYVCNGKKRETMVGHEPKVMK